MGHKIQSSAHLVCMHADLLHCSVHVLSCSAHLFLGGTAADAQPPNSKVRIILQYMSESIIIMSELKHEEELLFPLILLYSGLLNSEQTKH